ncbi:MAG: DNA polymerase III subunit alpha, partial [Firmicutes bacterium]|nr:DNA polymerase III subunit alpha [Bacillota bacterium]
VPRDIAETIFKSMISFAEYAFNKSHAAAYAVITYETAYLKYYYPLEYMTALLTSVMGDAATTAQYIRNCQDMGIEVLGPDINRSMRGYSIEGGKIRFGLKAVKNVGNNSISAILRMREKFGPVSDLRTFIDNIEPGGIKKNEIESLIMAGAMKSLEGNTAQHMAVYEKYLESAQNQSKNTAPGQISLFETNTEQMADPNLSSELPALKDFKDDAKLAMEKEMLGVYISGHPLETYREVIERASTTNSLEISEIGEEEQTASKSLPRDGDRVVVCGMVTGKRTLVDRRNNLMAFVQIEDLYGDIEVIVFSRTFEKCKELLEDDSVILVRGRLSVREDQAPSITADEIIDLKEAEAEYAGRYDAGNPAVAPNRPAKTGTAVARAQRTIVKLRVPADADKDDILGKIQILLEEYPGNAEVRIYLPEGGAVRPAGGAGTDAGEGFMNAAAILLGAENVKRGTKE